MATPCPLGGPDHVSGHLGRKTCYLCDHDIATPPVDKYSQRGDDQAMNNTEHAEDALTAEQLAAATDLAMHRPDRNSSEDRWDWWTATCDATADDLGVTADQGDAWTDALRSL